MKDNLMSTSTRFAWLALRRRLPRIAILSLLAALPVCLSSAEEAHTAWRVLDARMHHLRTGGDREWTEFAKQAEGSSLKLVFSAEPNRGPGTLRVRHRDLKQNWRLRLNDQEIGALPSDENPMTTFWEVPPGSLRQGENTLVIAGTGNPSDDIEVGDVRLLDGPRKAALGEASLSVHVLDAGNRKSMPARITVVDEFGSLMTVGAQSSRRLAVRPGVVYTADGHAEFDLPAGKYKIYAGRGFEYGIDQKEIDLSPGGRQSIELAIRREAPVAGYVSCDTHLHTLTYSGHGDASLAERIVTLAAEGLELPIATDHNVQIDYRPAMEASGIESRFTPVVGEEVTTRVGHFNVFPLDAKAAPLDHRGGDWRSVFAAIGSEPRRVIIINHPRDVHAGFRPFDRSRHVALSGESLDGWELKVNALELVNSGALQSDPWRLLHDWFGLLNAGLTIAPVGSSDSHDVARSIVGQARTYVRCRNDQPGEIDVAEAVEGFLKGRVLVSFGLVADLEVDGEFGPGDMVPAAERADLSIRLRVVGPSWSAADQVVLFVNGREIRRAGIPAADKWKGGVKYEATWTIAKPPHDVHLVAVALGPGVAGLYWPTAKPYQPDSSEWRPYTLGATGAVYVDADATPGFASARQYAASLVATCGDDYADLGRRLGDYDEAVACQVGAVLRQRGLLSASTLEKLLPACPAPARSALREYVSELGQNGWR
jgi:hypothetical protein